MKQFSQRELDSMSLFKIRDIARKLNIDNPESMFKEGIIDTILKSYDKKTEEVKEMFTKEDLEKLTLAQLKAIAKAEGIKATKKDDIINALVELDAKKAEEQPKVEEAQEANVEIKQEIVTGAPDAEVNS